jgi:hypothetical protein
MYRGPVNHPPYARIAHKDVKWPEIPVLTDYSSKPSESFWLNFPQKDLPTVPETSINVEKLSEKVEFLKEKMTCHQYGRCKKAIDYLLNGAPAFQKSALPGCFVKNAPSTLKHGRAITDNIATWVHEGYAAGPFEGPPCPQFRVNPLMAVVQPDKVRPVLNVSSPKGDSFNSMVDENETEAVKMASARKFSRNLLECGVNATMSKHDLVAAYKQVPCMVKDLRLQGFSWLGKFFVETRQVFGAKTSVCNYDIVGETLKLLATLQCDTPHHLILRQVDDVPVVGSADSGHCEQFSQAYKALCEELNVGLAKDCPLNDKAFTCQKRGKVLGVMFDSSDLTWRLSDSKVIKAVSSVSQAYHSDVSTLKEWQRLMGRLNDVSQMCSFMKLFKQPINKCVADIPSDAPPESEVVVSADAKRDLLVWYGFLTSSHKWLPIEEGRSTPPIWHKEFVSDAAGLCESADLRTGPGCGNVGFKEDGRIIFAHQMIWPSEFISSAVDEKGVRFGDKTTTLECIGLLMPLIVSPELFINSHVVLKVDCLGTVFGMENRCSRGDMSASVFIRAVYIIAAYLGCTIYVEHLPRKSDWGAEVADRLSRRSTTTLQDRKLLMAFSGSSVPGCLLSWFANPKTDWQLAVDLLTHVKRLV